MRYHAITNLQQKSTGLLLLLNLSFRLVIETILSITTITTTITITTYQ